MKYWQNVKIKDWFYEWMEGHVIRKLEYKYMVSLKAFYNEEKDLVMEMFSEEELTII